MPEPALTKPSATVHEFATELVVRRRSTPAEGVVALDLAHPDSQHLPRWEPGAHIDVMLSDGLTRQYSLCGDSGDLSVWRIGVLLDPNSRGGSRYVHENLNEGAAVRVRGPRNHFPLVDAPRYRFIAGGIGITPIVPMIDSAQQAGSDWTLLYGGRTRASMAFGQDLAERYPERLLSAVEQHCAPWPAGALHIERFAAKAPTGDDGEVLESFEVVCHRSGVTLEVTSDMSILETLEDASIPIMGSCYEGVCGTCEARVLEGIPVHRDSMLTDAEKATGEVMLICVSGSRTERLVLDL